MSTWYTSDLHLFHPAVSYDRIHGGWPADRSVITEDDVTQHVELLAQRWDAVVRPADDVWVLGDLTGNNRHIPNALRWMKDRPGRKHFISGNHDPVHPMHHDGHQWQDAYREQFHCVSPFAKKYALVNGLKIPMKLSHFPYVGDRGHSRFDEWRLRPSEDDFLLHGHTHSPNRLSGNQIHIGVDAWNLTPVKHEQVVEIVKQILDAPRPHWMFGAVLP